MGAEIQMVVILFWAMGLKTKEMLKIKEDQV